MFYFDCFKVDTYRSFCWHLFKLASVQWYNSWWECSTSCQQKDQILNKNTNLINLNLVKSSTSIISNDAFHGKTVFYWQKIVIYQTSSWSLLFVVWDYSLHLLHPIACFHLQEMSWATSMLPMLNIFNIFCGPGLNSSFMVSMQLLSKCGSIVVVYLLHLSLLHVLVCEIFNTAIFS